eukprot:SM000272S10282  [mRNA]  locus=s272:65484:69983:- [translate_table: standard]
MCSSCEGSAKGEVIWSRHAKIQNGQPGRDLPGDAHSDFLKGSTRENCPPSESTFSFPADLRELLLQQMRWVLKCTTSGDGAAGGGGAEAGALPPPLVLVHGSFHAAWCWACHWMPYLAAAGHDVHAVSLLGQGGSDVPVGRVAGTLQEHADCVADFIGTLPRPPILVGHSFGGLIVQAYLAEKEQSAGDRPGTSFPVLAGAVLACSVRPTGNAEMIARFFRERPRESLQAFWIMAAKRFMSNVPLCRKTFFSPSMLDTEVAKYQDLMRSSSKLPLLDLRQLSNSLPVRKPGRDRPPILVLGAENDFIVDRAGLQETADFFDTEAVVVPNVAHDLMLDTGWKCAADAVQQWLMGI